MERQTAAARLKRGLRRIIIVLAVVAGGSVAYSQHRAQVGYLRSCISSEVPLRLDCVSRKTPEACKAADDWIAMCKSSYNLQRLYLWPLAFGGLAALGAALALELMRAVVAWVIAGFSR